MQRPPWFLYSFMAATDDLVAKVKKMVKEVMVWIADQLRIV